jgi:hypothetical protein
MLQITEIIYQSLIDKIYQNLMLLPYVDSDGDFWERSIGEMGDTRDEAERIVSEWVTENSIIIIYS